MKIIYQEAPLTDVIEHYVKGFAPKDGVEIKQAEHFVDAQKGIVVFKLFIEEVPKLAVVP